MKDAMLAAVEAAPVHEVQPDGFAIPSRNKLAISEQELECADLAPRCIVEGYLYADVAVIVAPGGVGKTTLLLHEATCIALGRPVYGMKTLAAGWSLFVTKEDERERLVAREREIIKGIDLSGEEKRTVLRSVLPWDVTGTFTKLTRVNGGNFEATDLADEIVRQYKDDPPVMIVFDPLVSFGADENSVNTNEQAIVDAVRRIVRGLHCCVRLVHHTGQAVARDKTSDQYSGRGGSALSDGARMVAVMHKWKPGSGGTPPPSLGAGPDDDVLMLDRPKLSYARPHLQRIWLRRNFYTFQHAVEHHVPSEQAAAAHAAQVMRFLVSELKRERYYTRNDLEKKREGSLQMTRSELRVAITDLEVSGRVCSADLPEHLKQGARKNYLAVRNFAGDTTTSGEVGHSGSGKHV
jgi:RecA-family ATPase